MGRWGGEIAPAEIAEAITAGDTAGDNFSRGAAEGIYVGGAGNVAAVFKDGTAITFTGVPAGTILPVRAVRVNSTNTTATAMVALYTRT